MQVAGAVVCELAGPLTQPQIELDDVPLLQTDRTRDHRPRLMYLEGRL